MECKVNVATMTYDATNPGDFMLSGIGIDLSDGKILVPGEVSSIQEAIDLSNDGDTVSVAAGTYLENIDIPIRSYMWLVKIETTIIDGGGISSVINIWGADAGNDIHWWIYTSKWFRKTNRSTCP